MQAIERNIIYVYDGSFCGLMSCISYSILYKEIPEDIVPEDKNVISLFEQEYVKSDEAAAHKLSNEIREKISPKALRFIYYAYLSCLRNKEIRLLKFVYLGLEQGRKVLNMLFEDDINNLYKGVRSVLNEREAFLGFVRFSDYNGALVSVIEPKNDVLPILRKHFMCRFPDETFMIYDKARKKAFVYQNGRGRLFTYLEYTPPETGVAEEYYRSLWKKFYDTISIEERNNPKYRQSHMPKRYWENITEMNQTTKSKQIPW